MRKMTPLSVSNQVRGAEGKWVAMKDGRVIVVAETPDEVYRQLHGKQVTGATLLRVPSEGEPELVGLG